MSRKYKQHGYQDSGKPEKRERHREQQAPRPARNEQIGPRTPRMVGTVMRARCTNCGTVLQPKADPQGACPKCGLALHCCKQCVHFDTGARFECTQPVPERILKKDARNSCTFYEIRMTVEKDTAPSAPAPAAASAAQREQSMTAARPNDARAAFDNLFKK